MEIEKLGRREVEMCLSSVATKQYKRKRNWVEGYKVLRWTSSTSVWRSQLSSQKWEFAELVKAVNPSRARFRGRSTSYYKNGIHAWKKLKSLARNQPSQRPTERIVKVLLFGVTHHDWSAYRADAAIIIEALDKSGKRIPWKGVIRMNKLTIRKYDGDDSYSWAVFKKEDIKGIKGVIFYGQARPLVSGCSRTEARYHKDELEEKYASGGTT